MFLISVATHDFFVNVEIYFCLSLHTMLFIVVVTVMDDYDNSDSDSDSDNGGGGGGGGDDDSGSGVGSKSCLEHTKYCYFNSNFILPTAVFGFD